MGLGPENGLQSFVTIAFSSMQRLFDCYNLRLCFRVLTKCVLTVSACYEFFFFFFGGGQEVGDASSTTLLISLFSYNSFLNSVHFNDNQRLCYKVIM